ncbi:MAG: hypothetical protein WD275_05495, partial [Rhodothermales bacterium]
SIAEMRIDYHPKNWLSLHFHARRKDFEADDVCLTSLRAMDCTTELIRHSVRLQIEYLHSNSLRVRTRIEAARVRPQTDAGTSGSNGFLIFEDIRWRIAKFARLDFRLTYFDVGSYEARIYSVENDLLYAFSSPAPQGRGRRGYLLLNLATSASTSLQMKYADTAYDDVSRIGSGLDEIEGSRWREVKVQFRWVIE